MSLPILSNAFFEKHKPSVAVFEKWQAAAQWSAHFMPIYEWDDLLFVGCSQPPSQTVTANCKVVYVFCEAEILHRLWEEYQSPTALMNQQPMPTLEPEAIIDPQERTVVFQKDSPPEEVPEGLVTATVTPSAAPQSASFDDLGVNPDPLSTEESLPETLESALPEEDGGLEGLDLGNAPPSPSALAAAAPPSPIILEKTAISSAPREASEEVAVAASAPAPTPAPAPAASVQVDKDSTRTNITSITSFTSTSASPEQLFQGIFKEMGKNFQKSMLLIKQGEQIIPWKWDDQFEKTNPQHKKTAISLNVPSPFRVVNRTQKSYHGYIVPNDVNDKFFQEWNGAQSPDHVTLSPILIDDVLVGMVLGIGDKASDTKTTLLQTEHLAEAMAKKLKMTPQIFSAA